jgi:hypothetical protein
MPDSIGKNGARDGTRTRGLRRDKGGRKSIPSIGCDTFCPALAGRKQLKCHGQARPRPPRAQRVSNYNKTEFTGEL